MTEREKERKRLIELIQNAVNGCARHWAQVIADNLLSNGVIVLPCREGNKVYAFCDTFGVVLPYLVDTLSIGYMGKNQSYYGYSAYCYAEETNELLDEIEFDFDDIGKTVFLTEEEAEKALKERSEGK